MRLPVIKCHGSGNDFPLIDARTLRFDDQVWSVAAVALADRAGQVGGDGLLLMTASDADHAFGMRMFNCDGSESEQCLNGLRCVGRWGLEALGLDEARVRLKQSSATVARAPELALSMERGRSIGQELAQSIAPGRDRDRGMSR